MLSLRESFRRGRWDGRIILAVRLSSGCLSELAMVAQQVVSPSDFFPGDSASHIAAAGILTEDT
jgi:hypothetical protein